MTSESERPIYRIILAGVASAIAALCFATIGHAQYFDQWGQAVSVDPHGLLGVNTAVNDGCPYESPDGQMLFLASNRPGSFGFNDIWVALRSGLAGPWEPPMNLGAPVNSASNDFCPTPLPGNQLLFVSARANTCGGPGNNPDIYYTRLHPVLGWLAPQHLGCDVNSGYEEFSPSFVEAEGQTMLFFSSNRGDGVNHKIYMSLLQSSGSWGPATPVDELNTPGAYDARPNVRKDGLEIVFDSNRAGGLPDIYTATRSSVFEPWSAPQRLGPNVNTPSAETRASLSRDGTRLYFGSNRPESINGSVDIYVSTRSGPGRQ
jgi:Tol biopolymer transport system component